MCGIIYFKQRENKPMLKKLKKLYKAQKHRGSQGFGFVTINNRKISALTRSKNEADIFKELSACRDPEVLFHHRLPTSTPNTTNTAHPIPVINDKLKYAYYVVHNGIVGNCDITKKKYEADGFKYTTELEYGCYSNGTFYPDKQRTSRFNDSESLAIDVALAIENNLSKLDSLGSIAFMALQVDKETKQAVRLYFGRNDRNPLKIDLTNQYIKISSEGSGELVEEHKLHYLDYETGEIVTERDLEIGWKGTSGTSTHTNSTHTAHTTVHTRTAHDSIDDDDPLLLPGKIERLPIANIADIRSETEFDFQVHYDKEDVIPGYESTGLKIRSTCFGAKKYYYCSELYDDYVNLLEEVEYWKDYLRVFHDEINKEEREENITYYNLLLEDERLYKQECKIIWPILFAISEKQDATVPLV